MARSRIEGMAAVERVFRRAVEANRRRILEALIKSGDEGVARAKALAPVSAPQAGAEHVVDTIRRTEPRLRSDRASVILHVVAGESVETLNAAFRSEFGRDPGPGRHKGQPERPFIFPAYWSLRSRIRNRVKRAVNRAAKDAAAAARR